VLRRSTYFTHEYHVDNENCQWQHGSEDDIENVVDIKYSWTVKISHDTFDGLQSERAE